MATAIATTNAVEASKLENLAIIQQMMRDEIEAPIAERLRELTDQAFAAGDDFQRAAAHIRESK